ncbi:F-box/LRR-repeat protein 5-like [Argopecten irradians]|uniref:F-box/LRR-repeat protein 5-like n=1 Tax=Argopecten irradians TaxID=31199 RepID=UPI00371556A6
MAPKSWPDEVDVFTIPHSRMKELVQKYVNMVSDINFTNVGHLTSLLENLCNTFREFHNHEQVENQFIMNKLKEKLKCLSIKNHAVCNCHSDNRLTEMLNLFQDGYKCTEKTDADRINYGIKLRKALEDFTNNFLPHMEEEEEIFQPMLIKYFSYDELCNIKNEVLMHHSIATGQKQLKEAELMCDDIQEKEELEKSEKEVEYRGIDTLPQELMLKIFSHLDPRQLCSCAQVSQRWNELATDGSLWTTILPVQWAMGQWSFVPRLDSQEEEDKVNVTEELMADVLCEEMIDEDADQDESGGDESDGIVDEECTEDKQIRKEAAMLTSLVKHLLPRVGSHVKSFYLGYSKGLVNGLLYKILSQCPNLEILDLSQTRISDIAFKGLGRKGCGSKLRHLNLGGCFNITDKTLQRLSTSFNGVSGEDMLGSKLEKNDTESNEKGEKEAGKCGNCCKVKNGKVDDNCEPEKNERKGQQSAGHDCDDKVGKYGSTFTESTVDAKINRNIDDNTVHLTNSNDNLVDKPSHPEHYVMGEGQSDVNVNGEGQSDVNVNAEGLSDVIVNQALEHACDYLENLMKFGPDKTEQASQERPSETDSTIVFDPVTPDDGSFTKQTMKPNSQEESSPCLNKCGHCTMSAKHLQEADDSHSHQTTVRFYESKKPKRTTCDESNADINTSPPGSVQDTITLISDNVNICDNDLDLVNNDPNPRILEYLSLSGCYHITDTGLRYLAENGGLPYLRYLDLSGCLNITADGLTELVSVCPALDIEDLYYCDNVIDGPYAAEASGCQNLECNSRVCCRSGY